jgi:hypothetical protein
MALSQFISDIPRFDMMHRIEVGYTQGFILLNRYSREYLSSKNINFRGFQNEKNLFGIKKSSRKISQ